jgi:methyl-accepting chemotaxis protein
MFQKFFPQTLRNRILLTMTLTMLILVFLPAFLFYQNFMNTIATIEKDRGQTAYKQVLNTLKTRGKAMGMLSIAISNEPSVQELFHKKDRKALQKLMMPVFKKLSKVYKINVFHFHKQPAVSFLRMQKPEKFGDDLSGFRHTVVAANKTKKMIIALEKGVAGLSNRAVIPVFYKNMHIDIMADS